MPSLLSCCAALALCGASTLVAADGPAASPPPQPGAVPKPHPKSAPDPELSAAVTRALERADHDGWGELHIEAECQNDAGRLERTEIFGSGVGIWNREAQFRLTPDEINEQLQALRESGFADWPPTFGGKTPPPVPQQQPPRVVCRVALELDGVTKQVVQFQKGEQSGELRRLAQSILEASRGPALSGVRAESLNEGLRKLAAGTLAPETFQVVVNRRPPRGASPGEAESWLLRAQGGEITTYSRGPGTGLGEPHRLDLGADDLARLASDLRDADLAGLPVNLHADRYTTVLVRVLEHRVEIQARPFAGMTPQTHGADQERFDRVLAVLEALHERALTEGRTEAPPEDSPR